MNVALWVCVNHIDPVLATKSTKTLATRLFKQNRHLQPDGRRGEATGSTVLSRREPDGKKDKATGNAPRSSMTDFDNPVIPMSVLHAFEIFKGHAKTADLLFLM